MTATKNAGDPAMIDIAYDVSCNAGDHVLVYGGFADFGLATDADCSIGDTGTATSTPPSGSRWFLLVGREGSRYSSAGHSTAGERGLSGVNGVCPALDTQDTSAVCP
jgi:hypothetical protein